MRGKTDRTAAGRCTDPSPTRRGSAGAGALVALVTAAGLTGCATTGIPGFGGPASVPGFDTRDFPGESAMRTWLDASPYRWVGYYLPAPCHTGTSWLGRRDLLASMGWGTAVLFVGEQDWPAAAPPPTDAAAPKPPAAGEEPRCTRSNLSVDRGRTDAGQAVSGAQAEGFRRGTAIFLDVERVDAVSPALADYVAGWFDEMLTMGTYEPALYAHRRNVDALRAVALEALQRHGRSDGPRLWVAGTGGFDLSAAPADSGVRDAEVWQGLFDVEERWGGVTLRIDANVARSASPSG